MTMRVTKEDIQRTSREMLAGILHGQESPPAWQPGELRDILQHQLAAPLAFDFSAEGVPISTAPPAAGAIATFGELLAHPRPPLLLLEMTKDFAKRFGQPGGALPEEVGKVLYYAAIFCALLRHQRRITTLDDDTLRTGAEWALRQDWLHASLAGLFREGMAALLPPNP
jgi:hypothetical protein